MPEATLRALWPPHVPVTFDAPDDRYRTMRSCQCILAASGTATLETGLAGVPTVVTYKVSRFSGWIGRRLIKVPWVSLTNLIMEREVFPELLQEDATGERMADRLDAWLDPPNGAAGPGQGARAAVLDDLAELRRRCGEPGSAARAAERVLAALGD